MNLNPINKGLFALRVFGYFLAFYIACKCNRITNIDVFFNIYIFVSVTIIKELYKCSSLPTSIVLVYCIVSQADMMVKNSDMGRKGVALTQPRTKTKIPPEVKTFLTELFIAGERSSSDRVKQLSESRAMS